MANSTVYFNNNPHGNYASSELVHLGIIHSIAGKMRGVKNISSKPVHQNWAGMGWQTLKVELTKEGLNKVKSLKEKGELTLSFEVH